MWLDEARKHTDVLHIFVTEGEDITVPLSATGHGSVVTCPEIVDGIDFGPEFTGMTCHVYAPTDPLARTAGWSSVAVYKMMHFV